LGDFQQKQKLFKDPQYQLEKALKDSTLQDGISAVTANHNAEVAKDMEVFPMK
jgi:hypothetical protein